MLPAWLLNILQNYGMPTALLVFFIWRDWKREKSMTSTINCLTNKIMDATGELEKEMRDILKGLVIDCTKALVENTSAMRELTNQFINRPCIAKKET